MLELSVILVLGAAVAAVLLMSINAGPNTRRPRKDEARAVFEIADHILRESTASLEALRKLRSEDLPGTYAHQAGASIDACITAHQAGSRSRWGSRCSPRSSKRLPRRSPGSA